MIGPDDEQTDRARRGPSSSLPDEPVGVDDDDTTTVIRAGRPRRTGLATGRRTGRAAAPDPETTAVSARAAASMPPLSTPAPTASGTPGPRRTGRVEPPDTGGISTVDVRAGSASPSSMPQEAHHAGEQREAMSESPGLDAPARPGRAAHAPLVGPISYRVRSVASATVPRAAPVRPPAQTVADTAATEAAGRRNRRIRAMAVVLAAIALFAGSAIALVALLLAG